jgi:hypothetical protein
MAIGKNVIRRDYILRMIEEFVQALARISALKKDRLWQEAAGVVDEEFQRLCPHVHRPGSVIWKHGFPLTRCRYLEAVIAEPGRFPRGPLRPAAVRSAPRVLQGFGRPTAFANRRVTIPPIFSRQIGTGVIGGQLMAIAARCCSGHEQSVRDTELNNGKGFLSGLNPIDPIAETPGSLRHTQRFHGDSVAHASLGGQTPI